MATTSNPARGDRPVRRRLRQAVTIAASLVLAWALLNGWAPGSRSADTTGASASAVVPAAADPVPDPDDMWSWMRSAHRGYLPHMRTHMRYDGTRGWQAPDARPHRQQGWAGCPMFDRDDGWRTGPMGPRRDRW